MLQLFNVLLVNYGKITNVSAIWGTKKSHQTRKKNKKTKKNWQVEIITNKDKKNGENWQGKGEIAKSLPGDLQKSGSVPFCCLQTTQASWQEADMQQLEVKALSPCIYWPKYRFPVTPLEDFS